MGIVFWRGCNYGYRSWRWRSVIEWSWGSSDCPGEFFYIWVIIIVVMQRFYIWLRWTSWDAFIGWMLWSFVWGIWFVFIRSSLSFVNYLCLVSTVWVHKVGYLLHSTVRQFNIVFTLRVVLLLWGCGARLAISSGFPVPILISTIDIINAPWKWIRWVL